MAIAILVALGMGSLVLEAIPNTSPDKIDALRGHMIAGLAILALLIIRFGIRLYSNKPPAATTGHPLLDRLGRLTHHAFYLVIFLMAFSGIGIAVSAELPGIVFFGSGSPLPESFDIYAARIGHAVLAKLLMALIALHVSAAIYHQFIEKDGLLTRMSFRKRYDR